jgi:hypothetical protein
MRTSIVDSAVREADPVSPEAIEAWRRSPQAAFIRARAVTGAEPAAVGVEPMGRRRRIRSIALAAAILLVVGAGAGTAAILLGEPAPPAVKKDIGAVDAGFPADLRYNPDVANARSVATTGASTLYYAELKDGGRCTEIATSGVPRGAVCKSAAQMQSEPIELTIPFTDPVTTSSPVTIGGHVNAEGVSSVEIRYGDGSSDPIALGDNGFFIFDVPNQHVAALHNADFSVLGLNEGGEKVAEVAVPAIGVEPEGPIEDPAPITVDTISDASDFTKVLGVRGRVNAEGAVSLEFRYPDGATITVALTHDRRYSFDIPSERQGDLFAAPGMLIARDADGKEVASVPVAAVAFWRAHQGGSGG